MPLFWYLTITKELLMISRMHDIMRIQRNQFLLPVTTNKEVLAIAKIMSHSFKFYLVWNHLCYITADNQFQINSTMRTCI